MSDETTARKHTIRKGGTRIKRNCERCAKPIEPRLGHVRFGKGKHGRFCSHSCARRTAVERAPTPDQRFWSQVDKSGPIPEHVPGLGPCWVYTGKRERSGYARFWIEQLANKRVSVHRYSYALAHGPIPDGLLVMHRCDNRACVNPSHLRTGTHCDNTQDAVSKGRQARGETSGMSKLTDADVRAIRASNDEGVALAKRYSVSKTTISYVRRRKIWKHVA